jgi:hypothetical protein
VFCILNGRDLSYTVDDAERLLVAAAAGELDVPDLATWIRAHCPRRRDPLRGRARDRRVDRAAHPSLRPDTVTVQALTVISDHVRFVRTNRPGPTLISS